MPKFLANSPVDLSTDKKASVIWVAKNMPILKGSVKDSLTLSLISVKPVLSTLILSAKERVAPLASSISLDNSRIFSNALSKPKELAKSPKPILLRVCSIPLRITPPKPINSSILSSCLIRWLRRRFVSKLFWYASVAALNIASSWSLILFCNFNFSIVATLKLLA